MRASDICSISLSTVECGVYCVRDFIYFQYSYLYSGVEISEYKCKQYLEKNPEEKWINRGIFSRFLNA